MSHLDDFRAVSAAFERELETADPFASLQSVNWNVRDLGAHLAGVHDWVATMLESGIRENRVNVPHLVEPVARFYGRARTRLLGAFEATPLDKRMYTHTPANRTSAYWHRRQVHETLVHLWDLRSRSADATVSDVATPQLLMDGVRELFEVFPARGFATERERLVHGVRLQATDVDDAVVLGPSFELGAGFDGATWGDAADAVISAPAERLLLIAWNRLPPEGVSGDLNAIDQFVQAQVRP